MLQAEQSVQVPLIELISNEIQNPALFDNSIQIQGNVSKL